MSDFKYDSYCGLYCRACSVMKAYQSGVKDPLACFFGDEAGLELQCHGCKSESVFENCSKCVIRPCARDKGVESCLDCAEYPCQNYGFMQFIAEKLPHWSTSAANLNAIREKGIDQWLDEQAHLWQCPDCQTDFSWYATHCSKCGKDLSENKPYKNIFDKSVFQILKPPEPEEIFKLKVLYNLPGTDLTQVRKDIVYSGEPDNQLRLDLYLPPDHTPAQKLPVVVLVHGDGPVGGIKDSGQYTSLGRILAASGLIGVAFNHRMLMEGFMIKDVISDIEDLIQFLIKNNDKYGIDENRIAIWSLSAGVPFGLYAGIHNHTGNIKCMAAYYGFGDLTTLCTLLKGSINPDGIEEQAEKYSAANLLVQGPEKIAPLLIARAGKDQVPMLLKSLDKFIATALANNINIDVYNHPNGIHAFDLYIDEPRTREIMENTLEFFKKNLAPV